MRSALLGGLTASFIGFAGCNEQSTPTLAKAAPGQTSATAAAPQSKLPAVSTLALSDADDEGVRRLDGPAPLGSRFGDLHSRSDGVLVLSWVEPAEADEGSEPPEHGGILRFATLSSDTDATWSEPMVGADDPRMVVNWADFPRVFTFGESAVIATWPRAHDGGYGLWFRVSTDNGRSFGPASALPTASTGPEYGFPSFARMPDGRVAVTWLDGRNVGVPADGEHDLGVDPRVDDGANAEPDGHDAHGGVMQLRAATIASDGVVSERRLVDRRVCDCCQTDATFGTGPTVVYRDRGPTEIRDIHFARLDRAGDGAVHDDGWKIEGCPVNGPAIVSDAGALAVAWFSGTAPPGTVQLAFADDVTFAPPVRIDAGAPLGRVDVLLFGDHAVVSWLESIPGSTDAAVLLRAAGPKSANNDAHRMATVAAGRESGFPRLGALGDDLIVAYTGDRVRLAALKP